MDELSLTPDDVLSDVSTDEFLSTLQVVIEQAPDAIIVASFDSGNIVAVNQAAETLFDCDRSDLIGLHQRELHPPEEHEKCGRLFDDLSQHEGSDPVARYPDGSQLHIETESGVRVPVEISSTLHHIGDNQFVQGHFRDVSSRVQRGRMLQVYFEAIEQAGHTVMITDTEGHIEYVNPAFESTTGYDRQEVIGDDPSFLNSGVHDGSFYEEIWSTISDGEVWEGELVNEDKHGSRYHIEQTIAPIEGPEGDIERYVAINHDITERKKRRRQLVRERERLEEFAGTVAHDLRTPLSIATGHLDMVDDSSKHIDSALDALERMSELIDTLLTLSKQGKTVDDTERLELGEFAESTWNTITTTDDEARIEVDCEMVVEADRPRLQQLLTNLFENAIEHGGEGVTVVVEELADRPGFVVADDGPGINPNDRVRVFDSGVSLNDGIGYGLSIVQQIVQAHGWTIEITESDRGGTRFEVETDSVTVSSAD